MFMNQLKSLIFFVMLVATVFPVRNSVADISINDSYVVCAEVMPCDENGNVLTEFLEGGCATVYQDRCLKFKLNDVSNKENACNKELSKKNKKIRRLKSRIKFLQKR